MMYYKAKTFEDTAMMAAIQQEYVPAMQKKWGKQVTGFTEKKWDQGK